jgi:hypothetical protein
MDADTFWQQWRDSIKTSTGVTLPLTPKGRDWPTVMEISEMVETDALTAVLARYMALSAQERRKMHGAELISLGWFRTCLPALMQEQQQDETEKQKFLDSLNTHT